MIFQISSNQMSLEDVRLLSTLKLYVHLKKIVFGHFELI